MIRSSVLSPRDPLADGLALKDENTIPINRFRLVGGTDVAVLDRDALTRGCVKVAIEIKTECDMDTDEKTN